MRRRHRGPPPLPPPLGGLVVDGANVIAASRGQALARLDAVAAWCREFRPDLPVLVFVDGTTAQRCPPAVREVLALRAVDVTPGRPRYAVTPRGEPADAHLLQAAARMFALVVSNDRFFDHEDLRANLLTVQFAFDRGCLRMPEEATWFRRPGSAERVPLQVLAQRSSEGEAGDHPAAASEPEADPTAGT
jgi:hypothetical protein